MLCADDILNRMIFVGGSPRSGTTFAARSLNSHPNIVTAIDDHVYECWGLYYYRTRVGLIQNIRTQTREMSQEEVKNSLKNHLFAGNQFKSVASSSKTSGCPLVSSPVHTDPAISQMDLKLVRHSFPVNQFNKEWYLCLKSPEISYVLPQLAMYFPGAKFVLVYRPVIEIAESMYRIGQTVKRFPVFHKRWKQETRENGELIPPPGIPREWFGLWHTGSDFQRCVINAASYLEAVVKGVTQISPGQAFVYNHFQLRKQPIQVFAKLADFLGVDSSGFNHAITESQETVPEIGPDLKSEYERIAPQLNLKHLADRLESLNTRKT